jgi:hypothetical protein
MLKRIVGLALIAAAGVLVWTWLRRHQDDFANMNTQFAPPDLSIRLPPPSAAVAVSAMPSGSEAQATRPELPSGEQAPPQVEAALGEPIAMPEELDLLFEDTEAPQPPATPTPEDATGEDGVDTAAPAIEEHAPPADETTTESTPDANEEELDGVTGYCVRCKTKREIVDAHEETTESGRRAARGTCPVCGANMFTFLKEEPEDDEPRAESQ